MHLVLLDLEGSGALPLAVVLERLRRGDPIRAVLATLQREVTPAPVPRVRRKPENLTRDQLHTHVEAVAKAGEWGERAPGPLRFLKSHLPGARLTTGRVH